MIILLEMWRNIASYTFFPLSRSHCFFLFGMLQTSARYISIATVFDTFYYAQFSRKASGTGWWRIGEVLFCME